MGILFQHEESEVDANLNNAEHFEGVEKRLQIDFHGNPLSGGGKGLRALTRDQIDQFLSAAKCTIVSELSNDELDSYVLSESSLFIYPHRVIIKTCGTTRLLNSVPFLLSFASQLSLKVESCVYTRGSFLFPYEQPFPHGSFGEEVEYLESFFGRLGLKSQAYVLGDPSKAQRWHVYCATLQWDAPLACAKPLYTLEICMTKLHRKKAANFYKASYSNAAEMTRMSGISKILPKSQICDFVFDPCGYSMNSVESTAISTIHVTPEEGFSYASFETMGYSPQNVDFQALMNSVLCCFKPATFSVAVHIHGIPTSESKVPFLGLPSSLHGYSCENISMGKLPGGNSVLFYTFGEQKAGVLTSPTSWSLGHAAALQVLNSDSHDAYISKQGLMRYPNDLGLEDFLSGMNPVLVGPTTEEMDDLIYKQIGSTKAEDAFYVMDVGAVLRLWSTWKLLLPCVHPFYAVKCNSDIPLLSLLSALGAGFDVASKTELDMVRSIGVGGDRIIFANPCKLPSHISYSAKYGVHLTTFDSEGELYKLHRVNPKAEVVLRMRVCDSGARCPLGVKYGAEMEECEGLLTVAKTLCLDVVGIAFHVGSGASDPLPFAQGIAQARQLFDMANSMGMTSLRLLDIGGGFVSDGGHGVSFSAAASSINDALEKYFPPSLGITVIAEPGRFFAEEPFTLVTQVFGSRMRKKNGLEVAEYWINDGLYGSMNCLLYDHAVLSVRGLRVRNKEEHIMEDNGCESTIFGPTCDGLDTVMQNVWLPRMQCGDWLVFPRMGAYTKAAASSFNGFDISGIKTVCVCTTTSLAAQE